MTKYFFIFILLLSCSTSGLKSSQKARIENYEIAANIQTIKAFLISELYKNKRRKALLTSHPLLENYYLIDEKTHKPASKVYYNRGFLSYHQGEEFISSFAVIKNSPEELLLITEEKIFELKKVSLLKTQVSIKSLNGYKIETKQVMIQTGFPMTTSLINLDETIRKSEFDHYTKLDLIKKFEPNIYNTQFKQ